MHVELLPGEEDLLQVRTRAGVGGGQPCVVRRPTSTRPATQPADATLYDCAQGGLAETNVSDTSNAGGDLCRL